MGGLVPVQLIDEFLLNYNVGHAALLLFVLTIPLGLVMGSRKLLGLVLVAFGGLFMAVPSIDAEAGLAFGVLGIVLIVVGPVVYTTAPR